MSRDRSPAWHFGRAAWSGGLAGLLVGACDVFASWPRLDQFLPRIIDKALLLLHLAAAYALCAAVAVLLVSTALVALLRWTDAGSWLARARDRLVHPPDRPAGALAPLAYTLTLLPSLAGAVLAAYYVGLETILHRHHKGLIVAVVIAATLGFVLLAVIVALIASRLLTWLLAALVRGRALRLLSHRRSPLIAALIVALAPIAAVAFLTRETLAQLQLRPALVVLGIVVLAPLTRALIKRLRWPSRIRPLPLRLAITLGVVIALAASMLLSGGSGRVRKAAGAYSGWGGLIVHSLRKAADFDRDGYASVLGGGDCDDWNGSVYPGAPEIPDDGIDQNCIGGDVKLDRAPVDLRFVDLPPDLPPDLNVLMITIDALRADHTGAYGYGRPTTPTLDALAAEGALFLNAWAHAPSTRYSVPAILTGRYPSQVQWDTSVWWPGLRPENRTLAEMARDRDLTTGAILNYRYFNPVRQMNQGFDHYDNSNARLHQGRDPASTRGSSSRQQADAAIRYLDRRASERFFLWVHFYDPHYRWERHAGTPSFGDRPIDLYDHEIRFTDDHIGRVIAHLRELGLYERTVVIVTADHGEGFGERGIQLHGYHLYTPQTKVPLLIRVPGVKAQRITMPVGHIDLMPTLANLLGAEADPRMQGQSLVAELLGRGDADRERTVFQEVSYEGPTERRAAVTRKWQLIYNLRPDNTLELYSLRDDPGQTRDLWEQVTGPDAVEVKQLRARLMRWIDSLQVNPEAASQLAAATLERPRQPAIAIGADFGSTVHLLGVDIEPTTVQAGESFELTWYFHCRARPTQRWRVFVHVEGPTRFLGDHEPASGLLPFSQWKAGQWIADRHRLTVPATASAGTYTIYMGLFKGSRRAALHTDATHDGGENRLRVATIRVVARPAPR